MILMGPECIIQNNNRYFPNIRSSYNTPKTSRKNLDNQKNKILGKTIDVRKLNKEQLKNYTEEWIQIPYLREYHDLSIKHIIKERKWNNKVYRITAKNMIVYKSHRILFDDLLKINNTLD